MRVLIGDRYHDVTGRAARILRAQPGYAARGLDGAPQDHALVRLPGGARLFARVGAAWMDASLDDLTDPAVLALLDAAATTQAAAALGRQTSEAKAQAARANGAKGGRPRKQPPA